MSTEDQPAAEVEPGEQPLLVVNMPGADAIVFLDHDDGVLVTDYDAGSGTATGDGLLFETEVQAIEYARSRAVPVAADFPIDSEEHPADPAVAYQADDGVVLCFREGDNDWVQYVVDENDEAVDDPIGFDSLDDYFSYLIDEFEESPADDAG
jgi:hypothetical protein